jgi:hypothetical protein
VFSSLFHINFFFEFWPIILQNGTKYHAKFLTKKISILHFEFWHQEGKKPKKQKALAHTMKNLAFWMELKTPIKILVFCILSF